MSFTQQPNDLDHQSIVPDIVAVEATKPLTDDEEKELLRLERKVERSFVEAGLALAEIRDKKLWRGQHTSFASYCRARFCFTRDSADLKIVAALVYENIRVLAPTNGRCSDEVISLPLPTSERQLRPIAKAKLSPSEQIEAWKLAVQETDGKRPSGQVVKNVVDRIREKNPVSNPWHQGDVVRIIVKGNPDLKGRGGYWALVEEVHSFSVTVRMWDGVFPYPIRIEHLTEWILLPQERKLIKTICQRINQLDSTELEPSVTKFLSELGKLHQPRLTELEEKLLKTIEENVLTCLQSQK